MKCNEKNRFNVALLIENPPQTRYTIVSRIYGMIIMIRLNEEQINIKYKEKDRFRIVLLIENPP